MKRQLDNKGGSKKQKGTEGSKRQIEEEEED
jgi:hypothetical protein